MPWRDHNPLRRPTQTSSSRGISQSGKRCTLSARPNASARSSTADNGRTYAPARRAASAQILVRLHVEPHGEERELRAEDQQQRDEHDRSDRDRVAHEPQYDLRDSEPEAQQRHQETEGVEEDERVKVPDHVLLSHPPEETLHEQPGDPRDDLADLDPRLFADAVDRT